VSNDGGISYMLMATRYNESSFLWNQTGWIRLTTYVVRIVSSDGVLYGIDESDSNVTAGDPMIIDSIVPILLGPDDVTLEYSNESITLTWFVSDFHAYKYSILLNGSIYEIGFWSSSNLTIQIENYTLGTYNFTIIVNDTSTNDNTLSTILVIINGTSTTTVTTTTTTTITTTTTSESTFPTINTTTITSLDGLVILIGSTIVIGSVIIIIILIVINKKRLDLR
jgi:hypothetical protein